jgi:endogenous inhibitor of DNA gyrase (YacG/DUF329 family)
MPAARRCPQCKKDVAPRSDNPSFPFCSPRCRTLDLGRWLGEEYRVATQHAEEEEDERPAGLPAQRDWGDA